VIPAKIEKKLNKNAKKFNFDGIPFSPMIFR